MRTTLTAVAAAATIAVAAIAAPTTADARRGWWAPAIIGGLAAGAIIGSALRKTLLRRDTATTSRAPALRRLCARLLRRLLRTRALLRLLALAKRLSLSGVLTTTVPPADRGT